MKTILIIAFAILTVSVFMIQLYGDEAADKSPASPNVLVPYIPNPDLIPRTFGPDSEVLNLHSDLDLHPVSSLDSTLAPEANGVSAELPRKLFTIKDRAPGKLIQSHMPIVAPTILDEQALINPGKGADLGTLRNIEVEVISSP